MRMKLYFSVLLNIFFNFFYFFYFSVRRESQLLPSLSVLSFFCKLFRENCNDKMDEFLKRCFYHSGQYDSENNFAELDKKLKEHEVTRLWCRLMQGQKVVSSSSWDFFFLTLWNIWHRSGCYPRQIDGYIQRDIELSSSELELI